MLKEKLMEDLKAAMKEKDDLKTDPAGNSGERIACGKILRIKM